jgi:hypothetical protein
LRIGVYRDVPVRVVESRLREIRFTDHPIAPASACSRPSAR